MPRSSEGGRSRCARSCASEHETDARAFLRRATERATQLASCLGLDAAIAPATDPFFAPTARAKQLVQRLKELKHELLLPIGDEPYDRRGVVQPARHVLRRGVRIRLPDGTPGDDGVHGVRPRAMDARVPRDARARRRGWPALPTLDELAEVQTCLTRS